MRNIWRIFARDVQQATRNVIAIIVAIGLVIVPALYAWYNIAASWDPYGNTKALKVAVANTDKGYKSDLMPVTINVGETVVSALRANHQLDWQFVGKDKAIDGVHSGEYYAALVIPSSFSADMMTLFSTKVKHAELDYYLNEKINPIAPHITDEGASTVATTIDQTFVTTIGQVAIGLASNVAKYADTPQMKQYVTNATGHIKAMSSQLKSASAQVGAYASLIKSTESLVASTDKLLGSTGSAAADARKAMTQAKSGADGLKNVMSSASAQAEAALKRADKAYAEVSSEIDAAFDDVKVQTGQTSAALRTLQGKVQAHADAYGQYAESLRALAESATLPAVRDALDAAADQAADTQAKLASAAKALGEAAQRIDDDMADAEQTRADLKAQVADARAAVDKAANTYRTTLKPQLEALESSIDELTAQTGTVIDRLSGATDGMASLADGVGGGLKEARGALGDVSKALTDSAAKLDDLNAKFATLTSGLSGGSDGSGGSGTSDAGASGLSAIMSADPEEIASLLSAPVQVDRKAIYPIANYGSAMTPFYTILSIWVGAIVLAAMMKVSISDHEKAVILGLGNNLPLGSDVGLREAVRIGRAAGPGAMLDVLRKPHSESPGNARQFGLKLHQEYFGRYMIFGLLALLQGTLVCLGDLFYLGVQCKHPFLFLMTGWLASLVFSNLVYTLTVSFGDIGKAIAVVLLVMQVAGSGGTFPVETLPPFFQVIAKWLLFPYGVDAMHSAMAGYYGMEYWISMGKLALFLVPSLLLGLMLRKPVIRLNDWIIRNLESTKVM
ncbi:YhgE/Pip domain-containing protein [Bifidobacterium callitrichos]|uniref:YhgE/Pip domain-containing protein n=2 Tax=Bifidobacterium callitrichos TaxID=762209 RepID=A0A2T3G8F8_9BIFI|nr:YhgE/Pip domain-containing protein [Bifidobacterium callitrichos]KFI54145.1 YhgE/Pip N-terminal domain protein [Bifidobacterium callitrichos DSM 23973]PST45701.1 YhgE/Pip domain-containing protein [Bifidobacterium callitrichos]